MILTGFKTILSCMSQSFRSAAIYL